MSVEDRVIALIDEGNPIPDPNDLDRDRLDAATYLATLEPRSSEVTQLDTKKNDQKEKRTVRPWLVAAMVIILAGVALVLVNQVDKTPVAGQPGPDEVLVDYFDARNSGDLDAMMVFYAEDVVVKDHPLDTRDDTADRNEIRQIEQGIALRQGSDAVMEARDMVVSGNTVTFNTNFVNADGNCYRRAGNQVTVEDGKITLYQWGSEFTDCTRFP